MRLEGIQTGDIVEVDHNGRRFHAIVTGTAPGGLALQPTDRRVNYYSCRSREVDRPLGQARAPAGDRRAAAALAAPAGDRPRPPRAHLRGAHARPLSVSPAAAALERSSPQNSSADTIVGTPKTPARAPRR